MRGTLDGIGGKCGVGKESDIFYAQNSEQQTVIIKLARLGRISFRSIKTKRDYLVNRKSASWLYMSRLAAYREYSYMQTLHSHGLPVPRPLDWSRHCVVMDLVNGSNLSKVDHVEDAPGLYKELMHIILRFASFGLIHCDYNEFNIMVSPEGVVTVIDFPQMVSISHANAQWYFERDVECIVTYFAKRYGYLSDWRARWEDVEVGEVRLDKLVKASGVNPKQGLGNSAEQKGDDDDKREEQDDSSDDEQEEEGEGREEGDDQQNGPGAKSIENDNNTTTTTTTVVKEEEQVIPLPDIPLDAPPSNEKDAVEETVEDDPKVMVKIAIDRANLEPDAAEEQQHQSRDEMSVEDKIKAQVRRELQKKKEQRKFNKTKRQGKRIKAREGQRKVKEHVSESTGW